MVKDMDEEEEDFFDTDADKPTRTLRKGSTQELTKN